jgi:putative SOS response-associated peptidase YedK
MCGHFQRNTEHPTFRPLLKSIGLEQLSLTSGNFYPASLVDGIIFEKNAQRHSVQAVWWFLLDKDMKPNYRYATFNARKLNSRLWARPLKHNRCIIPVTAIGESKGEKSEKQSFLLEGDEAFFLGGLYNQYEHDGNVITTFSVITRDPHTRFSRYHDKATPLFMPFDENIIDQWLNPRVQNADVFKLILDNPKITVDFSVTEINSTRKLAVIGETERLLKDT